MLLIFQAGNHYGMSQPADALVVHSNSVTAHSEHQQAAGDGGRILVSLFISLIVMAVAAAGFMWYYRRQKKNPGHSTSNQGVSFENPTYLKDGISLSPATNSVNFNVSSA